MVSVIKLRTPGLTAFFSFVTELGGTSIMTGLALVLMGALFFFRDKNIFPSVAAILSGVVFGVLLKNYLHIARPTFQIISETGFSFPSGHALMSTIFFALVYKDMVYEISSKWGKFLLGFFSALLIFLICLSRVYLGVHFIFDVIAGFFLGTFWVSFWWALYHSRS